MALELADLAPHQSMLLARWRGGRTYPGLARAIVGDLEQLLLSGDERRVGARSPVLRDPDNDDLSVAFVEYERRWFPAWAHPTTIRAGRVPVNLTNELLMVCVTGSLVAVYISDKQAREKAWKSFGEIRPFLATELGNVDPIPADELYSAFVGSALRSLWLGGVHRPSGLKPSSKTLHGPNLEHAHDPIDDPTYFLGALRAVPADWSSAIGVNAQKSAVWSTSSSCWADFARTVGAIGTALDGAARDRTTLLPEFAAAVDIFKAHGAYEACLVAPPEDVAPAHEIDLEGGSAAGHHESAVLADRTTLTVLPQHRSTAGLRVRASVDRADGQRTGEISIEIRRPSRGRIGRIAVEATARSGGPALDEVARACQRAGGLVVHYDSGHTVIGGGCWEIRYSDHRFTGWDWRDLRDYDTQHEKPRGWTPGQPLGSGTSLFDWVVGVWSREQGRTGWLACDDGAGEAADFVHLDPGADQGSLLTLIHAKGAATGSTDRGIAVVPYEQVTQQAIKNLRQFEPGALAAHLAGRRNHVWQDGRPVAADGMQAALETVGSRCRQRVLIVQPHVTKTAYDAARSGGPAETSRLRRLDTVLLATRSICQRFGTGAEFAVISAR